MQGRRVVYLVTSNLLHIFGIPVFRSKNLAQWEQIGNILTRESQLPLQGCEHNEGIYAHYTRWHEGTFYLITTNVSGGGNFIVTAKKSHRVPWSELIFWKLPGESTLAYSLMRMEPVIISGREKIPVAAGTIGDCEYGYRSWIYRLSARRGGTSCFIWIPEKCNLAGGSSSLLKKWLLLYFHAEGGTASITVKWWPGVKTIFGSYEYAGTNPILTHRHLGKNAEITCVGHCDLTVR